MPDYKRLMRKRVAPKRIRREAETKTPRPGRFLSRAVLALIPVGLIAAAALGGRSLLMHFPDCRIKEVSIIDQEGKPVSNPNGLFHLNLDKDFSLFNFDMGEAVRDIRARHPQLLDVFIRKDFPNKLVIVVNERSPVAIIIVRDHYLVDAEGFVLPFKSAHKDLPKIIGIHHKEIQLYAQPRSLRLKAALNLLRELEKAKVYPEYKLLQIDLRQYSDITFELENNIEVKVGQGEFGRKALLLSRILKELKADDTLPKYIDMRFGHPVVKPCE